MRCFFLAILSFFLFSCGNQEYPKAENALDAVREYIDGTLKGDFKKSAAYLQKKESNLEQLEKVKQKYYTYNDQQRQDYRAASLMILKENRTSENESVIYYKNSFDNREDSINVIHTEGAWLVDL